MFGKLFVVCRHPRMIGEDGNKDRPGIAVIDDLASDADTGVLDDGLRHVRSQHLSDGPHEGKSLGPGMALDQLREKIRRLCHLRHEDTDRVAGQVIAAVNPNVA